MISHFQRLVFKTIADPFVGKISLFKVITGKIDGDVNVLNSNKEKAEKLNHLFFMRGKNQIPATRNNCRRYWSSMQNLQYTGTGDTLCSQDFNVIYDKINFPTAVMPMSILPKAKGDEEKISLAALTKLSEEDPVFKVERDTRKCRNYSLGT